VVGVRVVGASFAMGRTVVGRHIYAIGGNRLAAGLSGVNTRRVDFWIFVHMGLLASIAAIVTTSRAGAGVAAAGTMYELDAIAADRKSTRLNSSHVKNPYAVFCLY